MQRARRQALVALLPVLAVLALAGCRSEPGVAAYVGSKKYTIAQVDALATEGKDKLAPDFGVVRQTVLSWLIIRDVGQAELKRRGQEPKPDAPASVEAGLGLQPGSPLARLYVDLVAVQTAFAKTVTAVDPTEADQREVYSHLSLRGGPLPPFEQAQEFFNKESIGVELALRKQFNDLLAATNVQVNPQFAPLTFLIPVEVQGVPGYIALPLSGAKTSPVTEAGAAA